MVFAKIIEQGDPSAILAFGKSQQGAKVNIGHPFFDRIFLINEVFNLLHIGIAEQQQAMGLQSVPTGPANFLVIAFDVFG